MKSLLLVLSLLLGSLSFSTEAQARRRCYHCGTVERVERYVERGDDGQRGRDGRGHGGAVVGALIGAAVGNQVGSGSGRRAATVAGAIAGGIAGNRSDRRRDGRDEVVWEFRVRMDDGRRGEFRQYDNPDRLQRGDRVVVRDGYVALNN